MLLIHCFTNCRSFPSGRRLRGTSLVPQGSTSLRWPTSSRDLCWSMPVGTPAWGEVVGSLVAMVTLGLSHTQGRVFAITVEGLAWAVPLPYPPSPPQSHSPGLQW